MENHYNIYCLGFRCYLLSSMVGALEKTGFHIWLPAGLAYLFVWQSLFNGLPTPYWGIGQVLKSEPKKGLKKNNNSQPNSNLKADSQHVGLGRLSSHAVRFYWYFCFNQYLILAFFKWLCVCLWKMVLFFLDSKRHDTVKSIHPRSRRNTHGPISRTNFTAAFICGGIRKAYLLRSRSILSFSRIHQTC